MPRELSKQNKRQRLTSRQVAIIQILVENAPEPVTLSSISGKLEVSSRTVLRELDTIEKWFEDNDFHFLRKPGVGLAIQEEAETIQLLRELLNVERVQPSYSRKERRRQILGELLCAKEPIKSYVFRSRFHISEGTLTNDLDAVEEWFAAFHIRLCRRPGVGILLEGSENDRRQAIANAAFEFTDEGALLQLLQGSKQEEATGQVPAVLQDRLFSFIDPQLVTFVERVLVESQKKLDIKYTDSGFMALVVHLALAIQRIMSGEKIVLEADILNELARLPEFDVAKDIAERISAQFRIEIPREEIGFITMHLTSARVWPKNRGKRGQVQSVNTHQVVLQIVESVEREMGLPFHTCSRMIEELTSHMESMISRLSMNIHLDNDQVDSIRQNYPDIYNATERACEVFKELLLINDISPSEITFIAMHFVAAAETLRVERKRVAVAVVCPSGMGASRMLAANLMRSFHNIEIRQIVSALTLDPESLRESGIDLVISTVPLTIDFPFLCVQPIPKSQDILRITQAVEAITESREKSGALDTPRTQRPILLEDISSMTCTGEEILQLLQHFTIRQMGHIEKVEDLLGEAAGLFADSILSRRIIGNDFAQRESIGSTFLPELGIHLLHCRTTVVDHCRFGYLRLSEPIVTPVGELRGAVVLLAPDNGRSECVEVISRMSMLLVEDKGFLQALEAGDASGGKSLAQQALVKYYMNEMKRIGDGKL